MWQGPPPTTDTNQCGNYDSSDLFRIRLSFPRLPFCAQAIDSHRDVLE